MFQKPTLDEWAENKRKEQARELFDMYVDLIAVIKNIEPELVRQAIRVLKIEKHPKFDIKNVDHLRRLYPDEVPDVFTRLWVTEKTPAEQSMINHMVRLARDEWKRKLGDQGLLDSEGEHNFVSDSGDREPYLQPVGDGPHARSHKRAPSDKSPP